MKLGIKQGTPEWHEFRKKHLGSSDIASVMGFGYQDIQKVWLEKTKEETKKIVTPAMQYGKDNEDIARTQFCKEMGMIFEPDVYEDDMNKWAGASLDGVTFDNQALVEIKCRRSYDSILDAINGNIPKKFIAQIQWQLMVSGVESAYLFMWHPDGTFIKEIFPDKELQKKFLEAGKKFWDSVINKTEPPVVKKYLDLSEDEDFVKNSNIWKEAHEKTINAKIYEETTREKLLDCTDGLNTVGNGVKIAYIEPEAKVNWKQAFQDLRKLSNVEFDLQKYKKVPDSYHRVSLLGETSEV